MIEKLYSFIDFLEEIFVIEPCSSMEIIPYCKMSKSLIVGYLSQISLLQMTQYVEFLKKEVMEKA